MTYEMEYTAYLYSCGACGTPAEPPKQAVDWERVVRIAVEQSITYTVAMAIKKAETGCPDSIKNRLISSLRGAAIKNSLKTDGILDLVKKMEQAGVRTVILKGIDVARCYANPECRVSADTDLLIAPEDEEKAYEVLRGCGFHMEPRKEKFNHGTGTHPTLGIVELHVKLLPDVYQNTAIKHWQLDDRALQNCVKTDCCGKSYYALEPTDNLLFLSHHMLKHLMYSGISLRMMMDNALFAKSNLASINVERYAESMRKTDYLHTIQIIFGAMVKYCGFSPEDFPVEPLTEDSPIDALLTDLEEGGWQGQKNETERIEAWYYYRYKTARDTRDRAQVHAIKKEVRRDYRLAVVLPFDQLAEKYPSLKKHRQLYPFCVLHRIFTRGLSRLFHRDWKDERSENDYNNLSQGAKDKIELFKTLGLMSK